MFRILLIISLIIFAMGAFVFSNERAQNFIAKRAVENRLEDNASRSLGGDNLDVIFCGTASPMGGGRAQACVAVLAGDKFFIVDSGARSAAEAADIGLPLGRLDGVLLTHFHSDHIAALGELHLASWVQGRREKLPVYGGVGVGGIVGGFNQAYSLDYKYRTAHHGEALMPSAAAGLVAKTIRAKNKGLREIYNKGGLKISVFAVHHEPISPAYGYKFEYKGRSIVISGDTTDEWGSGDNLQAIAGGADLLIHEVLQPELVRLISSTLAEGGQKNIAALLTDTLDYHTSPQEAAALADKAGVGRLVFYHYAPVPQNRLVEVMFLRGLENNATDIILADDATHLRLPTNSKEIIEID